MSEARAKRGMPVRYDAPLDMPADRPAVDDDGVRALRREAWRCAVGQGARTVVDPSVREAWEVRSAPGGLPSGAALQVVLDAAAEVLGLGGPVEARFDKLVVYGPEGHFDAHRDTLRGAGHVATLVVRLRDADAGGVLWVGEEAVALDRPGAVASVFLPDVSHGVSPVEEGQRVTLVYQVHRSGPPAPIEPAPAEPRHPLGSVAGGQVALLRHRYHQEALTAGALVGEDRSLAAAWLADDPDASVQVATLEGSRQSYLGTDVEVSVRPVHALRGRCAPDGLEVFPSPRMAVALEAHRAPGGFAGWTGNEGTVSAHRYRGAALVRIPGPRGLLAPEVSAQLAMVDALADARADRLEEVLPALQATLAALRSGSWAQRLREQVATLPPPAASAAIQEAVEAWWKPLARLDDHELHLLHAPILEPGASRDALLAVGAEAVAAEAVAAGWSRWHESVWGPAPDALVSGLTYWAVDRSEASRLASAPQVRHLVLSTWPDDLEHLPELPSVEVLELLDPSAVSVPLDLQTTPRLRRLCWKGEVSGAVGLAGQLGLFGGPEAAGGPVHVALEAPGGELPEGVCTARLRSLALSPSLANQVVHGLHRLRGTPRLRRLALRGLASVEELPFDALPRLTHLTLHRASSVRGPLLLPSFVQSMLERLEHLSLRGFDLSAVDLSRCGRLLSLELDHCIGVGAAPPGGDLRSLSLSHTALPFPRSLLRLESLRVVGGGQALAIAACPPRLRELHLAELGEVCLRGLAGAPLRALHLERLAQLSHPAGWALPGLESLTLRHLPVSRCPVECPDLRFLEVVGLPLEGLGEEGLYELVDLTLCDLPGLGALPSWLVDCHRLQRLHLEDTGVPHLPSLEAFAELHEVWFLGEDRVVDDALAETLLAAPVLTTVTLVPPAPDRGDRSVRAQLSAAGRPPEEGDGSWGGGTGEDDIPF